MSLSSINFKKWGKTRWFVPMASRNWFSHGVSHSHPDTCGKDPAACFATVRGDAKCLIKWQIPVNSLKTHWKCFHTESGASAEFQMIQKNQHQKRLWHFCTAHDCAAQKSVNEFFDHLTNSAPDFGRLIQGCNVGKPHMLTETHHWPACCNTFVS